MTRHGRFGVTLGLLVVVHAPAVVVLAECSRAPSLGDDCAASDGKSVRRVALTWGATVTGAPYGRTVAAGIVLPDVRRLGAQLLTGTRWLVQLEAGEAAGAVRTGIGGVIQVGPRWKPFLPVVGLSLTAGLVRVWGDEPARPRGSYLALEAQLTLVARARCGRYLALDGAGPGESFWACSVGVGF
jgi:hypothetical protein